MSNKRILCGAVLVAAITTASVLTMGASAAPAKHQTTPVKLGFITKFPVDFYFTLVNAAKKWDKATPGAKVIYATGKSGTDDAGEIAAIQNMVAQGVKGIAITPTSPAVSAALYFGSPPKIAPYPRTSGARSRTTSTYPFVQTRKLAPTGRPAVFSA